MKLNMLKRLFLAFTCLLSCALIFAQTQYDYYDDDAVAGSTDRALNAIIFIVILVVGAVVLLILGSVFFNIYNWFNPKKSPVYKEQIRRESLEKATKERELSRTKKESLESANTETKMPKRQTYHFPDAGYDSYVATFEMTVKPQSKNIMRDLYSYKMYEGDKLISATNGAGTNHTRYDINPKEGTRIICDNAYNDYERRFEPSIKLPNSVVAIGNNAFMFLTLFKFTIPSSVKYITGNPFSNRCKEVECLSNRFSFENECLLSHEQSLLIADLSENTRIKVTPFGIKYIGRDAYGLQSPVMMKISSSVVAIADRAFGGSNIKVIVFEGKIKIVEESVFRSCPNLSAIYVPQNTIDYYKEIIPKEYSELLIERGQEEHTDSEIINKIIKCEDERNKPAASKKKKPKQTSPVTKEQLDFINNEKKNYDLSIGTKADYDNKVIDWGEHENEPHESYDSGEATYSRDGKKLLNLSSQESEYEIKMGTEIICDSAFSIMPSDMTVSFPSSVKVLGNFLYWGAKKETFVVPESVNTITGNPFATCEGSIDCKSPNFIYEGGVLYDKEKLKVISVMWEFDNYSTELDHNVIMIGRNAFYERQVFDLKLVLPPNLLYIADNAFCFCCMKEFVFSDKLIEIGDSAFQFSNIKYAHLPDSLHKIGKQAFSSCESLESVELPSSIETIEEETFYFCTNLKKIIIPEGIKVLKKGCFNYCNKLEEVYFPDSLVKIETDAFTSTKLHSVVVPRKTVIEEEAFSNSCEIIYRN